MDTMRTSVEMSKSVADMTWTLVETSRSTGEMERVDYWNGPYGIFTFSSRTRRLRCLVLIPRRAAAALGLLRVS